MQSMDALDTAAAAELVEDRQRLLLEQLAQDRRITTNRAAEQLGVSVDTVRRDLRLLHDRGLLRRVHGGAIPLSSLPDSFSGRSAEPSSTRLALATAVVERFRSGDVIGLDAGSTNVEVASQIPQTLEITVITNSPATATVLADHRSVNLILLGGTVDLRWMASTGPETVDGWRNYHLDLAILGACGFDAASGASTRSPNEVFTKRALVEAAATTVLPLQVEKLGDQAPFHVVDTGDLDQLILESSTDDATIERCRAAGLDVSLA